MFNVPVIWLVIGLALLPGNAADRLTQHAPITIWQPTPAALHTQIERRSVPTKIQEEQLTLTAEAVYAIDIESGSVLYSKTADQAYPIASITKLATVITFLRSHQLDQVVTIPALPAYGPADEVVGLKAGEQYTVRNLIAATLIKSANDAADALAIIDSGSIPAFSAKMTQRMEEWGISGTSFSNPSGLTTGSKLNTASAQAVAQMGMLAIRNPNITQAVATTQQTITSTSGRQLSLRTTNQLLQSGDFTGIKTGYTPEAGQCFVGLTTIQGHRVVTVVLGSQNRFGETNILSSWIDRNYLWQ